MTRHSPDFREGVLAGLRRAQSSLRYYGDIPPAHRDTAAAHIKHMADSFERHLNEWSESEQDRRTTRITEIKDPHTKCVQCGQMYVGPIGDRYGLCSATCELAADRDEYDYRGYEEYAEHQAWRAGQ